MNLKDLTVFVISGKDNPCFNACIQALKSQTVSFKIEIIKGVSPMSAAFQLMIDNCKTDYYVEVDEDMVLNENGIKKLYDSIRSADEHIAIVAYRLFDVHLNFEIVGIKIYKHKILKQYPYNLSAMSCEIQQLDRLKRDGYKIEVLTDVIGQHAPYWTDEGIFERYYNLMDKFKVFKYGWIADLPLKLWNMVKTDPSDKNLFALLGIYSSLITDNVQSGEKDFKKRFIQFDRMADFLKLTAISPPISKKLKVCKIIDQFGWAYYFITKEQQRHSSHDIEYKRISDMRNSNNIDADVVYMHGPNLARSGVNELMASLKSHGKKIIGGYGGESRLKYDPEPDIVVSISIKHVNYLKSIYPNKPVVFLPESVDTNYFTAFENNPARFNVGWAGSYTRDIKRTYLLSKLNFNVFIKKDWGEQYFFDGQTLDEMRDFYRSIDTLVTVSLSECMPRVVLEAMACGLPVVSTDVGCIGMLLEKDWIVPVLPDDKVIVEMNKKLSQLKNNPVLRRAVGQRNRRHIEKFFSWSANQKLWDRAFELVAQGRPQEVQQLSESFIASLPNERQIDINPTPETVKPQLVSQKLPNPKPIFISYYTKDTEYENEYVRLESSLKNFKLDYEIVGIPSQGDWFANCFYRSKFIRDMLDKHKQAVVWVDCDAVVQQLPKILFELDDYDFAFHLRSRGQGHGFELLGGTMYFNCTDGAFRLLKKWSELVTTDKVRRYRLSQSYLSNAIDHVPGLRVYHLPPTYCQIFDLMKDAGQPVIEHFQASRRYRLAIR